MPAGDAQLQRKQECRILPVYGQRRNVSGKGAAVSTRHLLALLDSHIDSDEGSCFRLHCRSPHCGAPGSL
jgi:hypothetical protein